MCFRPKSRASMDHAPGPTIAKLAPRTASPVGIQGSPGVRERDPQFNNSHQRSQQRVSLDPAAGRSTLSLRLPKLLQLARDLSH